MSLVRLPDARPRIERALLLRHLAFCLTVILAFVLRDRLKIGGPFLILAALAILVNLGVSFLPRRAAVATVPQAASLLSGVFSWCCLAFLSGGVDSPFSLGPGLEILLSIFAASIVVTSVVTVAGVAGLWIQQGFLGEQAGPALAELFLLTTLFLSMGALAVSIVLRWRQQQEDFTLRSLALGRRVTSLERELDDLRPFSRFGEDSARMIHALKNAVFNLRGYCQLLETHPDGTEGQSEALRGLRQAVERLENSALATLHPLRREPAPAAPGNDVRKVIEEALREVGARHPGVQWELSGSWDCTALAFPPAILREVLLLLAQNAVEAMRGQGAVVLTSSAAPEAFQIEISDTGPGIDRDIRRELFRPGVTSKATGSGLGLFLARRMVESHGGSLVAAAGLQGGATFTLRLPIRSA